MSGPFFRLLWGLVLLAIFPAQCDSGSSNDSQETYDFIFGFSAGYQGNAILSMDSTYSPSSTGAVQFAHEGEWSEMKGIDLTTVEWEKIGYEEEYIFVKEIFMPHMLKAKGAKKTVVDLGNHINYFYRALTSYLMVETNYKFAFIHITRERNEAAVSLAHQALRTEDMTSRLKSEWHGLNEKDDLCEYLAHRFCPYNRENDVIVQISSDHFVNRNRGVSSTSSASDTIKKVWLEEFTLYQQAFWIIDETEERYHKFRAEFPNVTAIDIVWAKQWPQSPDAIRRKLIHFMGLSSTTTSSSESSSIVTALNSIDHNILQQMTQADYMLLLYKVAVEDSRYRNVIKCIARSSQMSASLRPVRGGTEEGGEKCYRSMNTGTQQNATKGAKIASSSGRIRNKRGPDFVFCLSTGHVGTTVLSSRGTYNITSSEKVLFLHELGNGPLHPIESIKTEQWAVFTYDDLYAFVKEKLMPYYISSKVSSETDTLVDLGHHIIYYYQALVDYLMQETNYSFAFVHIFRQPQEAAMSLSSTGMEKTPSTKQAGQLCPKLWWRVCPHAKDHGAEIRLPIPGGVNVWHTFTSYQMAMWMLDEINERLYDIKYDMQQQQQLKWRKGKKEDDGKDEGAIIPKFQTLDITWGKTWPTSLTWAAKQVAELAGLPVDETPIILEYKKSHAGDRSENFELLYTMALLEAEYKNIMGQSVLCLSSNRSAYQRERFIGGI